LPRRARAASIVAMTRLSTARLDLRLLDERDAALYARLYTCPRVMAQIGPPLDAVAAERAFTAAVAHNRRALPGHRTWTAPRSGSARSPEAAPGPRSA
jgi:RimJ/RimL family protein N-acetyltransferase